MVIRIHNLVGERQLVETENANQTIQDLLISQGYGSYDVKDVNNVELDKSLQLADIEDGEITNLYLFKKGDKINSGI